MDELNFLDDDEKFMLAQYLKRLCFEEVYVQAEGDTKEERKDYTYRMLNMLAKVRHKLAEQGFAPR